jgi:hypothetical protein
MTKKRESLTNLEAHEWLIIESISRDTNTPLIEVAYLYRLERFCRKSVATSDAVVTMTSSYEVHSKRRQLYH